MTPPLSILARPDLTEKLAEGGGAVLEVEPGGPEPPLAAVSLIAMVVRTDVAHTSDEMNGSVKKTESGGALAKTFALSNSTRLLKARRKSLQEYLLMYNC